MSVEIGCDRDDRVFVRWAPGGPWTVLDRDGRVTTEPHALGATIWGEDVDDLNADPGGDYDTAYEEGYDDAIADARTAVSECDVSTSRRDRRRAAA